MMMRVRREREKGLLIQQRESQREHHEGETERERQFVLFDIGSNPDNELKNTESGSSNTTTRTTKPFSGAEPKEIRKL